MKVNLIGISPYAQKSCPLHSHDEWEIVLNLDGEGTTVIGDREYNFYPGTIICQPPNIPHSKSSDNKFKDIFIRVTDFIILNNNEIPIFVDDEEKSFETLMFLTLCTFHKKAANSANIVESLYETMQQMLLGWGNNKPKNETIELFKNELINNFMDPEFKMSDIMKKTSYCNDHLRRCFKKDTGATPITYLTNLRIEHAKKLLKQKSCIKMAISQISYLCGYYDPHYFSRVFKSKTGMTPQNYMIEEDKNDF
jgi:AraC-type DNA-binding domain-containing proteins